MIFGQKIIFFKTDYPTAMKFGILVPRNDLVEKWAGFGNLLFFNFRNIFFFKFLLKIIFFKTADQTAFNDGIIQICSNCD